LELIDELKATQPELVPQALMVDGNGFLHPRGFGFACHLGVVCDIPSIGIGKNLLFVDGLKKKEVNALFKERCHSKGENLPLIGDSGQCWGAALLPSDDSTNPIYVSIGHRFDLETAVDLVTRCCLYRNPEPVRQADLKSRDFIRNNYS